MDFMETIDQKIVEVCIRVAMFPRDRYPRGFTRIRFTNHGAGKKILPVGIEGRERESVGTP